MKHALLFLLLFIIPQIFTLQENNTQTTPNEHKESSISLQNSHRLQKQAYFECEGPRRLPKDILPTNYNVTLQIDPDDRLFNGSVIIDIQCVMETDQIVFHASNLTVNLNSISVWKNNDTNPVSISNIIYDKDYEIFHLNLGSALDKGDYVLKVTEFRGFVQNETKGLFLRTYEVKQTPITTAKTRRLIASQLQHTYARSVFPCFDEPNMKATFEIRVEHPPQYKSFSSMPLTGSTPGSNGWVLDSFEKSVVLPTYAVAVVVGNYSTYPMNGLPVDRNRILVPEEDLHKVKFAFGLAEDILTKLESYTKIPYSVSKVDHVTIPNFTAVAMENWGLITYDKNGIVDNEKIQTVSKVEGLTLIAHELAHQWFGNMVTTEWWSYLWLNEGFATYFQYLIPNKILPQWQLMNHFMMYHFQGALNGDAATTDSKPAMTSRRCTPTDFEEAFNEISYSKGACILRMFEFILGADHFQGGLRLYLQRRSMKNARPSDLFQVFDEIAHIMNQSPWPKNVTFTDVATGWTEQAGFPVVTVTRDYSSSSVHVKQERFFDQRAKNLSLENQGNRWWIPLTWNSASSRRRSRTNRPQDWLYEDKTIRVSVSPNEWLLFNIDATGFYRVNYDVQNWDLLRRRLENYPDDISVPNRIQLINDAFSLGFAHRLNLGTALNMTRYLRQEANAIALVAAVQQFEILYRLFASSPDFPKLESYLQKLMREAYRRVRLDISAREAYIDKILRIDLASTACSFGLDVCLIDAHFALVQFLAEAKLKDEKFAVENLHQDIQSTVLCGGIRFGGRSVFQEVRSLALNDTINSEIKQLYRTALSCTNDFQLLTWHLTDIFDNNTHLSYTEASEAVKSVLQNQRSLYTGYQFIKNNVNKINHFYNCSTNYTEQLVKEISTNIRTNAFYDEMRQWINFSNGDELGNKTELLRHLESRKLEVEWSTESSRQISDWLNTPQTTLPEPMINSKGTISAVLSLSPFIVSLIVYLRASL